MATTNPPTDASIMADVNLKLRAISGCEDQARLVSWDDVQRSKDPQTGLVSSWGPNITDSTLCDAVTGAPLWTIRCPNWDERLGFANTKQIAIIDQVAGAKEGEMAPRTLHSKLCELGLATNVDDGEQVSVRIQTVIVRLPDTAERADEPRSREVVPKAYSYQCRSVEAPPNVLLAGNGMGTTVDQNRPGASRIPLRKTHEDGTLHDYALNIEATRHKASAVEMIDTAEERKDAIKRGKTASTVIGLEAFGQRSNVLFVVQVPVLRQQEVMRGVMTKGLSGIKMMNASDHGHHPYKAPMHQSFGENSKGPIYRSLGSETPAAPPALPEAKADEEADEEDPSADVLRSIGRAERPTTSAGRASNGIDLGRSPTTKATNLKRDPSMAITVTFAMYVAHDATVGDGLVEASVLRDIVAMHERLYKSCSDGTLHLSDCALEPVTDEITKDISETIAEHPPPALRVNVVGHDVFPA